MKKNLIFAILIAIFVNNVSFGAIFQKASEKKSNNYGVPMCFADKRLCVVGNYFVQASGSEVLFVENGIVCNERKTQCTNGSYVLSSSEPVF